MRGPETLESCSRGASLPRYGRTLAQGALAWIWSRSERTIPIPGFKSVKQAEENARALELGALDPTQMSQVAEILAGA
jgi:aryl-alcohol dehydrogenase-like predicted oxidoreductase